jgi:hypothetical protein
LVLEPTGQQSAKTYPTDDADARIVWQQPEPSLKTVEELSDEPSSSVKQASTAKSGS